MRTANLAKVKNELSRFVAMAKAGERVRILVRGAPAADLVPIEPGSVVEADDDADIAELVRLGIIRRGAPLTPADLRMLEKPGPRVRGVAAVEALLAERRARR